MGIISRSATNVLWFWQPAAWRLRKPNKKLCVILYRYIIYSKQMADRIISAGGLRPHHVFSTQPLTGDRTTVCPEIISFHIVILNRSSWLINWCIHVHGGRTVLSCTFICLLGITNKHEGDEASASTRLMISDKMNVMCQIWLFVLGFNRLSVISGWCFIVIVLKWRLGWRREQNEICWMGSFPVVVFVAGADRRMLICYLMCCSGARCGDSPWCAARYHEGSC